LTTPAHQDGNLPAALAALQTAIHGLIGETPQLAGRPDCPDCHNNDCPDDCEQHTCPGHLTPTESLYMQIYDAVGGGRTGQSKGTSRPRSLPTGWIDAQQIIDEIDTAVAIWQPAYTGTPATVGRLRWMLKSKYRPQDVHGLEQKTQILKEWATEINTLFDPPSVKHFSEPCPACGAKTAYRKDSAGEVVRMPALQIVTDKGCTCQACHYVWGPELYVHLARVLGCDLPAGVLE
jgi:hypothetical protein